MIDLNGQIYRERERDWVKEKDGERQRGDERCRERQSAKKKDREEYISLIFDTFRKVKGKKSLD